MKKGLFISFEGSDSSGKTTQIKKLRAHLEERGFKTILTREPGGTDIGEKIRHILLDNENNEMTYLTEALLYAAARAQHVSQIISPALESGTFVISDRFVDSSIAYQGFGRCLGEDVSIINDIAVDGCMPDITFFLNVEPQVSIKRVRKKKADRIENAKDDYHYRVYEGYLKLADKYRDRIVVIDGSQSIGAVAKDIFEKIDSYIDEMDK